MLVAVGRCANGNKIGADKAGVAVTDRGFIPVDRQMRTNVPHIFAIGDLVGQPMLAHKATHEGKVAAEVAAGQKSEFVARVVPSVAYTDPEIAWVGVTETEAKKQGIAYGVGKFPHAASGRAVGIGRTEGFTKLIFDEATHRIIGGGIVAPNAGDLISEVALAIEMGCRSRRHRPDDPSASDARANRSAWRPRFTRARSPISTSRRKNRVGLGPPAPHHPVMRWAKAHPMAPRCARSISRISRRKIGWASAHRRPASSDNAVG